MPGHMGAEQVTIQNLSIAKVDAQSNIIAIRGAVPGPKGAIICIKEYGQECVNRERRIKIMPVVKVYDMKGTEVGEMELSDSVFGIEL